MQFGTGKTEAAIEAILFAMGNAVRVDKIACAIGHNRNDKKTGASDDGSV